MSWIAIGAAGVSAAGSIAGGMMGKGKKGPDQNAMMVNQQATQNTQGLMGSFNTYMATESMLPQLYTYMGYTPAQITKTMQNNRLNLASSMATEALRQRGSASGANEYQPLESAMGRLGYTHSQGTAVANGSGEALPDVNVADLPKLTQKLDPNVDWRTAGGGKFSFDHNVQEDPLFKWEEQLRERNQNMSDASKGLLNSGYSAQANAFGANALAMQEGNQMYGRQLGEYQMDVTMNQMGQTQDMNKFGMLLGGGQFGQQSAQFGQSLVAQSSQTNAQLASSLTGTAAQANTAANWQNLSYTQGIMSNINSGIGTMLKQYQANGLQNNNMNNPAMQGNMNSPQSFGFNQY